LLLVAAAGDEEQSGGAEGDRPRPHQSCIFRGSTVRMVSARWHTLTIA
jgi:hypothetical protein